MLPEYQRLDSSIEFFVYKMESDHNLARKDFWIKELKNISVNIKERINTKDWNSIYSNVVKLHYFFAPRMGSFSEDITEELKGYSLTLIGEIERFLKYCWKQQGNESSDIKETAYLKIGERVNLSKNELLSVSFGGHREYAYFDEDHTYIVIKQLGTDVTSMPIYLIKHNRYERVARHNALVISRGKT